VNITINGRTHSLQAARLGDKIFYEELAFLGGYYPKRVHPSVAYRTARRAGELHPGDSTGLEDGLVVIVGSTDEVYGVM
jgi:hypothetical protein